MWARPLMLSAEKKNIEQMFMNDPTVPMMFGQCDGLQLRGSKHFLLLSSFVIKSKPEGVQITAVIEQRCQLI